MVTLHNDSRGQISADLIFVTLVAIVIMAGFVSFISNESNQNQNGNLGQARMQGEKIAEALNTAYINGNGYSIYLDTPEESDFKFNADINNTGYVTVFCEGQNVSIKLVSRNVTNFTMVNNKRYQIQNVEGTVNIKDIS